MKLLNLENTRATMAPFETIEQLNANTNAIRTQYSEVMTPTEKAVLDVLHRFASKHFGVSYLSKTSIAEKVGVSRRQVIRICNKFEAQGIIVQYATDRRAGGGQTSNTIVFLTQVSARSAFVDNVEKAVVVTADVTPVVTGLDAPKDALEEKKTLKITRDTEACAALVKNGLVSKLPKTLQHALAPFFDAKELYEMTGVIYKAKASVDKSVMIEDNEKLYYDAILKVMNMFGQGRIRESVAGVLYRAIEGVTQAIVNESRNDLRRELYGF